nr:MAG TPA: DNA-binding transcriptional regulator [Caudoviricetes sp.]
MKIMRSCETMKTEEAIKKAGSRAALAMILGVTPQSTYVWKDELPEGRVWQLRNIRPEWFSSDAGLTGFAEERRALSDKVSQLIAMLNEVQREIEQMGARTSCRRGRARA